MLAVAVSADSSASPNRSSQRCADPGILGPLSRSQNSVPVCTVSNSDNV